MCDFEDNRDDYGFERRSDFIDAPSNFFNNITQMSAGTIVLIIILFIIGLYLLMSLASVFYAWSEYPNDELSNKLVKSSVAFIFSHFYLIYTFGKLVFLKNSSG